MWDGRTRADVSAPDGCYSLTETVEDTTGVTHRLTRKVTVVTGTKRPY